MARSRPLAVLLAAVLLALVAAGCGAKSREELAEEVSHEAVREGLIIPVGELDYVVYITRQLNPHDPEDQQYYDGEPPPGETIYGVFLAVCAPDDNTEPHRSSSHVKIVDSRGNEYEPLEASDDNPFHYEAEELIPGACTPNEASAVSFGPTGGKVLLFQLPKAAQENRPLELEIEGEPGGAEHTAIGKIELDL